MKYPMTFERREKIKQRLPLFVFLVILVFYTIWWLINRSLPPAIIELNTADHFITTGSRFLEIFIWPILTVAVVLYLYPTANPTDPKNCWVIAENQETKDRRFLLPAAFAMNGFALLAGSILIFAKQQLPLSTTSPWLTWTYLILLVITFCFGIGTGLSHNLWKTPFRTQRQIINPMAGCAIIATGTVFGLLCGYFVGLCLAMLTALTLWSSLLTGNLLRIIFCKTTYVKFGHWLFAIPAQNATS